MVRPAMITSERIGQILGDAASKRTLVLGDMVVDEHIIGAARQIAREAPIPVIDQQARLTVPGGATNVAANLRSLGCDVAVAGVVGSDAPAERLRQELETLGIGTRGLVTEPTRAKAVKQPEKESKTPQTTTRNIKQIQRKEHIKKNTVKKQKYNKKIRNINKHK